MESARLARSAVGSHGCAAYLHLLSPLFSLLLLRRHWALSAPRVRRSSSGPPCSSFDFSVSLVLAAAVSRLRSRADRLLLSIQQFAFSSSPFFSSSSLSFSLSPPMRVSSRTTGRSCNLGARIYARINHRGKRSRAESKRKRTRTEGEVRSHVNAPCEDGGGEGAAGCRRSLSPGFLFLLSTANARGGGRENFTARPRKRRRYLTPGRYAL